MKDMDGERMNTETNQCIQGPEDEPEEVIHCAFCQEELVKERFVKNPYGNFIYCQGSKLLYFSLK